MVPEYLEQAVDPEVIGKSPERLVEGGSLERWDGLDGGDDPEIAQAGSQQVSRNAGPSNQST